MGQLRVINKSVMGLFSLSQKKTKKNKTKKGTDGLIEWGEMQFEANETDAMLMQAAADGDCARLQNLIDDGACVYYREPGTGRTALHAAAEHGHREAIELLLENHHPWFVHSTILTSFFFVM